jgi:hypothetical protein
MKVIEPKEIIETISNLKTGEVYKNDRGMEGKRGARSTHSKGC